MAAPSTQREGVSRASCQWEKLLFHLRVLGFMGLEGPSGGDHDGQ